MVIRLFITMLITSLGLTCIAAKSSPKIGTEQEALALYCMQSDRMALSQLEELYAGIAGTANSPVAKQQLLKHRTRLENVEKFIKPRLNNFDPSYVAKLVASASKDFHSYAEQGNTCNQACKHSSCLAKCLNIKSDLTQRVESCLHTTW